VVFVIVDAADGFIAEDFFGGGILGAEIYWWWLGLVKGWRRRWGGESRLDEGGDVFGRR
jgi:hypothetical protein